MATKTQSPAVTPGQAKWIVERLIAERRISSADVQQLLSGISQEIADIERRLTHLRGAVGSALSASPVAHEKLPTAKTRTKTRRRKGGGRKGHPRGIAGTLAVLLRSIPAAEHAAIAAIRADRGIKAAILAARVAAKRQ
jgi:hypothetical protein